MNSFTIDGVEFGVDPQSSKVELRRNDRGLFELTVEVGGAPETFDELTRDEESEWSWALYPPFFFARAIPVSQQAAEAGAPIHLASRGDLEMALYMMDYNVVTDLTLRLGPDHQMRVSGSVDVYGEVSDFEIAFTFGTAA